MQRQLQPGVNTIQRKYIDSFLNYVILRVLGLLSKEEMDALGGGRDAGVIGGTEEGGFDSTGDAELSGND
jgi:hypothetical protein